ncbi:unnamed protein product [Caenorhabditis brenneri]
MPLEQRMDLMDGLFQKIWLLIFTSLLHLILLPLIVLCSGKKSDSNSVAPTQETGETAIQSSVGNESGSKMTQEAEPKAGKTKQPVFKTRRVMRRANKGEMDGEDEKKQLQESKKNKKGGTQIEGQKTGTGEQP